MSTALAAVTLVASLVAALGGVAPTSMKGDATRTAIADTTTRLSDAPCPGCFASLPSSDSPAPLLVLLHGDFESASAIYAKWRTLAEAGGIAVFAPACPESEGCRRSWWRWN
jgi:poly(3-hydroxybutyrate) depolymerase